MNQIYIVDGSVFDFKTNKYPLGIIMANARRIGKYLAKKVNARFMESILFKIKT